MESTLIKTIAGEMLDLSLTDAEAVSLAAPLDGLRKLVQTLEAVPLPFPAEPFISPRLADDSLEHWPGE